VYDFVRNADVLIHDSTYTDEEYIHRVGWGHSPVTFSLKVAREGDVRTLILFHHDHTHTDERVDAIMNQCRKVMDEHQDRFECVAAKEGMVLDV
jgi:ribonuclease BN (tRNA processing enzyme)